MTMIQLACIMCSHEAEGSPILPVLKKSTKNQSQLLCQLRIVPSQSMAISLPDLNLTTSLPKSKLPTIRGIAVYSRKTAKNNNNDCFKTITFVFFQSLLLVAINVLICYWLVASSMSIPHIVPQPDSRDHRIPGISTWICSPVARLQCQPQHTSK